MQYVDSELYATTSGQDSSQMTTYPVYAVGDYTPGQQYYTATTSNFTSNSSNGSGNNSSSYIVPVEESILGVAASRGSPQALSAVCISNINILNWAFFYN